MNENETPPCKTDPKAPHGFDRNASHNANRYVCECEGWEPVDAVNMTPDRVDETAKGEHVIDCTDEQLIEEVRRRGFVIRDAQVGKKWVGLTDADKQEAFDETQEASGGFWEFADYLEAKLKEKNA